MKFLFFAFTILVSTTASAPSKNLQSDFDDLLSLLPIDQIRGVTRWYLNNDEEFQGVVRYLKSPAWAEVAAQIAQNPTWQEFKNYLTEAGMDVNAIIEWFENAIDEATLPKTRGHGVKQYLNEIMAIIPDDKLLAMINEKARDSKDFREFYDKVSSPKARQLFEEVRSLDQIQRVAQELRNMGVDLDRIIRLIFVLLGWEPQP